jgi:hypothetical protein
MADFFFVCCRNVMTVHVMNTLLKESHDQVHRSVSAVPYL